VRARAVPSRPAVWSSRLAVYLSTAGAAVGLGSIWRFPYLAGTGGGSAFILIFVPACVLIATPLLIAEFAIGRRSARSPPNAAGAVAADEGYGAGWNAIGIVGSVAAFLLFSYYSVIAGWVLAYAWKCAAGALTGTSPAQVRALWGDFLSNPLEVAAWHVAFVTLVVLIAGRSLNRGIEIANKIRAPGLLLLLLVLVAYSLTTGDVRRGLMFAFKPNFSAINAQVVLAAIGQAFYATGVGQAMMIAYGAYVDRSTSLLRTSLIIMASILLVSLLATILIFPLVFRYGMNPAQGPELVFDVLPRVFAEIPGGRMIGTLFFFLLVLAALMPSIALLEPAAAWLIESRSIGRMRAICLVATAAWFVGLGTVLSFSLWSTWHPLSFIPTFSHKSFFEALDYLTANLMLPIGALLTCAFVGWRLSDAFLAEELAGTTPAVRHFCRVLLRYFCPLAILGVLVAAMA
jgi:NSS family neurotransmitter:Na+ symporter